MLAIKLNLISFIDIVIMLCVHLWHRFIVTFFVHYLNFVIQTRPNTIVATRLHTAVHNAIVIT